MGSRPAAKKAILIRSLAILIKQVSTGWVNLTVLIVQADIQTLPGGRYAVARFKGKTENLANAWMWLTREWMPSSGLQCDDRPCFEMFSAPTVIDPQTGEFNCEICIPVRAL